MLRSAPVFRDDMSFTWGHISRFRVGTSRKGQFNLGNELFIWWWIIADAWRMMKMMMMMIAEAHLWSRSSRCDNI